WPAARQRDATANWAGACNRWLRSLASASCSCAQDRRENQLPALLHPKPWFARGRVRSGWKRLPVQGPQRREEVEFAAKLRYQKLQKCARFPTSPAQPAWAGAEPQSAPKRGGRQCGGAPALLQLASSPERRANPGSAAMRQKQKQSAFAPRFVQS